MPLLSSPLAELKHHYDVVVIGSGYGGSIAASALARARRADGEAVSVCLLERGAEIPVGRFPDTVVEAAAQFQVVGHGKQVGREDALFWMHAGRDISVIHGCGLGGTSLINANVSLPPEERVWQDSRWPAALLDDLTDGVAAGFERAKKMLRPNPYPGSPRLKKLDALRKSAAHLGAAEQFYPVPINVNFEGGRNHVGVEQPPCNGCGDCVSGCNVGSKNTLMMNYLPDARNHGAEIFCQVRVSRVAAADTVYRVFFQPVGYDRDKFEAGELFVTAKRVVISAGALGSTEVLLRSQAQGLSCSDRVGQSFTGNGDVLGFGYNNDSEMNGIGAGEHEVSSTEPAGPCITGIIDRRKGGDYKQAHVIEEGVIPGALAPLLPGPMRVIAEVSGRDTDDGLWDSLKEAGREWLSMGPGGAYRGAIANTQTYLIMSHDPSDGVIALAGDGEDVDVVWPGIGDSDHFRNMNDQLYRATEAHGGTYVPVPMFNKAFGYGLVTVHPLGGCAMGDDATKGATNHKGQVFRASTGTDCHEGLYVMDGAVLPCSVGVNPLLTISAIAERNVRLLAQDCGWTIDDSLSSGPAAYDGKPPAEATTAIQFTEKMAGHCSTSVLGDGAFEAAEAHGKEHASPCHFVLTIRSDDVDGMVADREHTAGIVGTVFAPALSGAPMSVFGGTFNLFVQDPDDPALKRMRYRMSMRSVEGEDFYFDGYKMVRNDAGADVWSDTTTLYITIRRGPSADGPKVAQGVLHISEADFAKQMTTMKAHGPDGKPAPLAVAKFGRLFARNLWDTYGISG